MCAAKEESGPAWPGRWNSPRRPTRSAKNAVRTTRNVCGSSSKRRRPFIPSRLRHQFTHRNPQRHRDPFDVHDRNVPLAPLDRTDVIRIQPRRLSKPLLAKPVARRRRRITNPPLLSFDRRTRNAVLAVLKTRIAEQVGRFAMYRLRDAQDVEKGNVPLPTFDLAHMGTVDSGGVGQRLL